MRGIGAVLVLKIGMNRCVKGAIGAFDGAYYKNKEIHNACIKEAKHINEAREYTFIKDGYKRDIDWVLFCKSLKFLKNSVIMS